jgi:transcriptional regulator GlxA family with amidase domain
VYGTELVAPFDVFHHTVFHQKPGMRVFTVAPSRAPVVTFEGLRLIPDHEFADAPEIDVLVVPSAEHSLNKDLENAGLIGFVRDRGAKARAVFSLCDGAFVLGKAGFLAGRRCTTFPADVARLRDRFPEARVIDGLSFVRDGQVLTSAGGAKSYEAALYLVEDLYGAEAARGVAKGLCIDWDLSQVPHIAP